MHHSEFDSHLNGQLDGRHHADGRDRLERAGLPESLTTLDPNNHLK